jgi:hypothetical protein
VKDLLATPSTISIELNAPAIIKFITETGIVSTVKGERATYNIPQRDGNPSLMYVRIEVEDDSGERLFLQPVTYK